MIGTLIFIFGLLIGSFLNAAIYRLEVGGSLVKERSRCPKCKHILSWYELFPVFSFLIQKGRCRACKEKISWQYPIVELLTAGLFLLSYVCQKGDPLNTVFWYSLIYIFVIIALLVLTFIFDFKHYIIPNEAMYPLILLSFIYDLIVYQGNLVGYLASALLASGFFGSLYLVSRGRWIGMGDVKYGVFMGLFLGWPNILAGLFIAYVLGAIFGLFLISLKKKGLKSEMPFGPFLIFGTIVSYFFGEGLIHWYMSFLVI